MPEIPQKLRDAWRQNDAVEMVDLLNEQTDIEPLRPILL